MQKLRILADDPAVKNYGRVFLIVKLKENSDKLLFRIRKTWLVQKRVDSTEVKQDILSILNDYHVSVEELQEKCGKIDIYIAERFMPRGGAGTIQGCEAISMMLSLNIITFQTQTKLIPAVSWKTQIKRYYDLKDLYKRIKPCPEHLLDATLIGLYAAYSWNKIKPYSTLTKEDVKYLVLTLKRLGSLVVLREKIYAAKMARLNRHIGKTISVKKRKSKTKKDKR